MSTQTSIKLKNSILITVITSAILMGIWGVYNRVLDTEKSISSEIASLRQMVYTESQTFKTTLDEVNQLKIKLKDHEDLALHDKELILSLQSQVRDFESAVLLITPKKK